MPKLIRFTKQHQYSLASYYPACPSIPAKRKVSEESIHWPIAEEDSTAISNNDINKACGSQLFRTASTAATTNAGSLCGLLRQSSSSSFATSSSGSQQRLKRRAPSECLSELAATVAVTPSSSSRTAEEASRTLSTTSSVSIPSPVATTDFAETFYPPHHSSSSEGNLSNTNWGYFVDLVILDSQSEEEFETATATTTTTSWPMGSSSPCHSVFLNSSPNVKRRRVISASSPTEELTGFFLRVPTVDDAAFHLSSLSF